MTKFSDLDSEISNERRRDIFLKTYMKEAEQKPLIDIVEKECAVFKEMMQQIDTVLSQQKDESFSIEYAGRIKYCLNALKKVENGLSVLKKGEKINNSVIFGNMAYLMGELIGMKYTMEAVQRS